MSNPALDPSTASGARVRVEPAIRIEQLSKVYQVQQPGAQHGTFMDAFGALLRRPFDKRERTKQESFWALRGVSFEVQPGEVVGIVGRNGAGKSTLLKVLSRIAAPTSGRVTIRGRVSSLLEVGTGFHPEFTGRENVYMNGSILGMTRAEIDRKFDAIVDFAGIERFLDTPLKRYSSGMQVRLAFAVAAYLDPEILIVDEVLAVGDAEFQKRCLGRLQEVSRSGRTVLFVSHNLGAVRELCTRGVLLDQGAVTADGPIERVIAEYISHGADIAQRSWSDDERVRDGDLRLRSVSITHGSAGEHVDIAIETRALRKLSDVNIGVVLRDAQGDVVLTTSSILSPEPIAREADVATLRCRIPGRALNAGRYSVSVWADIPQVSMYFMEHDILAFTVELASAALSRYPASAWIGPINPLIAEWRSELVKGA